MVELLKEWQRTHYSSEVTPDMDGKRVIVMGWCREIRDLGGIKFIKLGDRNGSIQVTINKKQVNPKLTKDIDSLGHSIGQRWHRNIISAMLILWVVFVIGYIVALVGEGANLDSQVVQWRHLWYSSRS